MEEYQPVIGLEIHVELKTKSKMFCRCKADHFGKKPNTQTCPVCLGMPGALPVPNKKAVEWTIKIAKALNCHINRLSKFDRKHYFYPDLPKGYQISQYDEPIGINGWLELKYHFDDKKQLSKKIRIRRVHLEEDTGKLLHMGGETLIDFNRSGVPLVEIVSEPDFDNSFDIKKFLEELQVIIRYLEVSDCDMEKGSMRLEPNISVMKKPQLKIANSNRKIENSLPSYKVEIKNINSFRFVKQAIDYEIKRQIEILKKGKTPIQETRGFDEEKQITYSQRSKEYAHDYRYFPEPDIPPLIFGEKYLESIKIPELPNQKLEKYVNQFGLRFQDAFLLTRNKLVAEYFEKVNEQLKTQILPSQLKIKNFSQALANIIINKKLPTSISSKDFVKKAYELLTPKKTDEKMLKNVIEKVIENNKKAVDDYKNGKQNALQFLLGQVMREMKGNAQAKIVIEELKRRLT